MRKTGIFGGTLNPIHHAHLIAAETVREKFQLDEVLFIPTGKPPHKPDVEVVSALHRYNMVKAAVQDNPFFQVSHTEIDRDGFSYTIDTLTALSQDYGESTDFYFIIGADIVPELVTWKNFEKVFTMCSFIAVMRPGYKREEFECQIAELEKHYGARIYAVEIPLIEISSTNIRERIKAGKSIKYLVPQCIEEYIAEHGLYKYEGYYGHK